MRMFAVFGRENVALQKKKCPDVAIAGRSGKQCVFHKKTLQVCTWRVFLWKYERFLKEGGDRGGGKLFSVRKSSLPPRLSFVSS